MEGVYQEHQVQESLRNLHRRLETELGPIDLFVVPISKVPDKHRKASPSSFSPWVLSIGPLHTEDENVQAFKRHKTHYVMKLLSLITSEVHVLMELCIARVYDLMNRIKERYVGVNFVDDRKTACLLCIDALFILGFFLTCFENGSHPQNMPPIETILHDLVLLENQIPLFVLDDIYNCTILVIKPNTTLATLLLTVLSHNNPFPVDTSIHNDSINDPPHILGLLHQCYMSWANNFTANYPRSRIPSGASLLKAGVNLRPNTNLQLGLTMKVTLNNRGRATLEMPVLHVGLGTESVLWNFIVYERLCTSCKPIASYLNAMGMLMKTKEDVDNLVASRVLINSMGTGEEVAKMINNILKNVNVVHSFYEEEWKRLNKYYDDSSTTWLKRICHSKPMKVIGSVVLILTFASGVVQTLYTIKSAENK
ncbi:hypothetical protein HanOQP8_Chr01g0017401 [Helianthus annuus]|nr:hypothetical protein HanOQP8_Chr01g0017401 [Helianthus annuus]